MTGTRRPPRNRCVLQWQRRGASQMFELSPERFRGCLQGCALWYETNDVPPGQARSQNVTRKSSKIPVSGNKLPISPVPHTPHNYSLMCCTASMRSWRMLEAYDMGIWGHLTRLLSLWWLGQTHLYVEQGYALRHDGYAAQAVWI